MSVALTAVGMVSLWILHGDFHPDERDAVAHLRHLQATRLSTNERYALLALLSQDPSNKAGAVRQKGDFSTWH